MSSPGPIGSRLDRYEIVSLLGSGGFGSVYKAKHVHTDAMVALKVLKRALGADAAMVERFLREARAAASVGSDHIVRVLDAGTGQDGTPFLVLELLEGVDLKDLATQNAPLPPMRVVLLCLQVLEGLEAAHRKGIVHRDMKPANAFVVRKVDDRGTDKDFVKLLDFGISKMHGDGTKSGLTMTGMAMGTPSYMAPEQFFDARSVDARADVYSVAVMMYELLSGRLPIDASSYAELIVKVKTEQPAHLSQLAADLPGPLTDAVMTGLAKEKEQRWPSARDFANALRASMGMPAPGSVPLARPATLGAHKAPADSPSMMMGATATPQRATPMPQSSPVPPSARAQPTPAPAARPPTPAPRPPTPASAQGWVVPAPSGQTPQPVPQPLATGQPPQVHTPQPLAPNQSTPSPMQLTPGQTPMQLTPGQVSQPVAPPSSGALKWVLIIGGSLIGLCCLCGVVGQAIGGFDKQNQFGGVDNAVPTIEDVPSEPVAPVVPALPSVKEKAGLDPNGTEIYDSLKIDRSAIEEASQVLQNTPEIPSTEQIRQLAEESGASPADVKKVVAGAKRLNELRTKWKSKGTLTKADAEEVLRLMDVLDNL